MTFSKMSIFSPLLEDHIETDRNEIFIKKEIFEEDTNVGDNWKHKIKLEACNNELKVETIHEYFDIKEEIEVCLQKDDGYEADENQSESNTYLRHLKTHLLCDSADEAKSLEFDLCNSKTMDKSRLKRCLLTQSDEKPIVCNISDYKACGDDSLLQAEVSYYRTDEPKRKRQSRACNERGDAVIFKNKKQLQCENCNYKTIDKSNFGRHKLTHSNKKPFQCKVCDYKTNDKSHLKRHSFTHISKSVFKCGFCNYKSNKKLHVLRHLLTHENDDQTTKCDICDYRTVDKSNLKRHKLKHGTEKPFQCNVCDYKTNDKSHLKRHSLVHRNESLFNPAVNGCTKCYTIQPVKPVRLVL